MNAHRPVAALVLVNLLAAAVSAAPTDWPGWLGPNRDGHSPDTGLLKQWPAEGPKLLWKTDVIGPGWSSVAVVNGLTYTTGNDGDNQVLFCFDDAGKLKWKVTQGPRCSHGKYSGARSTPVIDGDRLYVTGGDGLVTCHALADGKIIWQRHLKSDFGGKVGGWLYAESVLILGDLAIVTPGGANGVVALDKATGKEVWKSDYAITAGYVSCLPITEGGSTIIVQGSQSGIFALDAKTGQKIWSNAFAANNTANVPTPAYENGMLFWGVGYGKGCICFRVSQSAGKWTFEEAWTSKDMGCHPGNYVVANGKVYGKGRGLACLDLKTGKTLWTERGVGAGQVAFADGMLYVFADSGGNASLVEPGDTGGKLAGKIKMPGEGSSWSHPVIINGRLYLRYDTNLHCFDVKGK